MNKEGYPKLQKMKLADLKPASYNPRKISSDALGRLTKSLSELGNLQPITWNAKTENIVGGHQRLKCYSALQKEEVEVWAVWLDEAQEKAANIALNKLSGEFDLPALKDILEEIDTGEIDLDITGFSVDELADLMEQTKPEVSEDDVPEVPIEAVTKPGDLYILGEHRLLCGDSTKNSDVGKLMNGEKADIVFTDPPYGLGDKKSFNKDHFDYEDEKPFDLTKLQLAKEWLIWGANYYDWLPQARNKIGWIVWDKRPTRENWDQKTRESADRIFGQHFEIACTNISEIRGKMIRITWGGFYGTAGKPEDKIVHKTQKPIELAIKCLQERHKIILDYFLGSGSTIIACEKTNRKCYGMEISPQYCDVIVRRWENLTGKKARLEK